VAKKITEEIKKAIIEEKLKDSKISINQLAEKYNISPTSISKILKQAGIKVSKQDLLKARKEEVYKFIEEEMERGATWRYLTGVLKKKFGKSDAWARAIEKKVETREKKKKKRQEKKEGESEEVTK